MPPTNLPQAPGPSPNTKLSLYHFISLLSIFGVMGEQSGGMIESLSEFSKLSSYSVPTEASTKQCWLRIW